MTTPRPIEPSEIRVGDKVCRTESLPGDDIRTYEFTVADRCVNSISSRHAHYKTAGATWTILDRPEPPREVGSRWRDPETDVEYILSDYVRENGGGLLYLPYRKAKYANAVAVGWSDRDADIIARLVPLDGTR